MIRRGYTEEKRSLLRYLILSSTLVLSAGVWAQDASDDDDEDTADLDRVVVTGSRIARTEIEGPQPVTILTSADIEEQGFSNAYEALESLTQFNGTIQDDQFGGFTQAANSLNLRSLGPGRTLWLLNGRRVSDYPLAFNGQSNVVNLSDIAAVDAQQHVRHE